MPENYEAWNLWSELSDEDREYDSNGIPKPLKIQDIVSLCQLKNRTVYIFDNIRLIENTIYPVMRDKLIKELRQKIKSNLKAKTKRRR